VNAGQKTRDGRERIKKQAKEFDHTTAAVNYEVGSDDKGKAIN
jgi:hypothetical protein